MALTSQELQAAFRIGESLIEPRQNRLVRGDREVHLESRVMDVLVCLAEHAGEVVSRDTLNAQVWGNVVVTDQAVTNCISELRQHLGHGVIETIPKRGYRLAAPVQLARNEPPPRERRWIFAGALVLLGAVVLGSAWWWWRSTPTPSLTSIAVLRFENAAGDASLDYLGLALPDEIATLLTKSRDLAVRPIEYVDGEDAIAAARARRIEHIVTGRYYLEDNNQLSLAIEALHVPQERVIWRTRISAPAGDLLAMRARIATGVQQGLLPALGASAGPTSGSMPAHDEAYRLYLRSLALPKQPKPTERAIEMLERVVQLEPQFAPAWEALGTRYYDHGTYGTGAEPARQQSLDALRKALELDPELISAARQVVIHRAEAGDLEGAYAQARQLLERFGPTAQTHFSLAFVYRFGGMLEESQRHCELALDRDPDPRLRSCAYSYLYAGKLDRVMNFLMLDEGSYFVQWGTVLYQLRRKDRDAALHVARQAADEPTRRLMEPCLEGVRGAALDAPAAEFIAYWQRHFDWEAPYAVAPMLLHCGRQQDSLRFLERAVDGNFCSFPAVDLDPIWTELRDDPEFQRIRSKALACHERFRGMVEAYDRKSSSR
jgi:DNA-binding winged helix-turn-helix (wHTH) protein/tetratricopeptide (TPR) repeat protein